MSRANANITPLANGSILVTFALRNGGEAASYTYSGDAAVAILAGDDPKNWPYDEGGVGLERADVSEAGAAAGELGDIAEIGELGAL
jgi:hypothetical protein